jgi:thiol:disulfide interchange protein DsbG
MKKMVISAVALAASVLALSANADSATPKALEMPLKNGMKIDKSFPVSNSLNGWVLSPTNGSQPPSIVYTTADGNYLLAGILVDANGQNLTQQFSETQIPKPDYAPLFSKLEKSGYVAEGAKNPKQIIYAFMDPNCIFCHLMWKAVQPYEQEGLQVRWVQVGFLKPDSAGKAAALLESKDAEALLKTNETKYDEPHEEGGMAPLPKVSDATQAKLAANAKLMQEFGFSGTPAIVYKDKAGKVQAKPGMPRLSTLPDMFGLPAVPNTDAELDRFK